MFSGIKHFFQVKKGKDSSKNFRNKDFFQVKKNFFSGEKEFFFREMKKFLSGKKIFFKGKIMFFREKRNFFRERKIFSVKKSKEKKKQFSGKKNLSKTNFPAKIKKNSRKRKINEISDNTKAYTKI